MDHTGAYMMAIALLSAIYHQRRTGEGQWVDMACMEAAATLNGPALLDRTANDRPLRRDGSPNSNRHNFPAMAPHGIYPTSEDDRWVAVACRNDDDWAQLAPLLDGAPADRWADPDALDDAVAAWTRPQTREQVVASLAGRGVPAAPVLLPPERIDHHERTAAWGLWPSAEHTKHGTIRVDGLPVHLSRTDWHVERGGPLLGEDNDRVLSEVLGLDQSEIDDLRATGVI